MVLKLREMYMIAGMCIAPADGPQNRPLPPGFSRFKQQEPPSQQHSSQGPPMGDPFKHPGPDTDAAGFTAVRSKKKGRPRPASAPTSSANTSPAPAQRTSHVPSVPNMPGSAATQGQAPPAVHSSAASHNSAPAPQKPRTGRPRPSKACEDSPPAPAIPPTGTEQAPPSQPGSSQEEPQQQPSEQSQPTAQEEPQAGQQQEGTTAAAASSDSSAAVKPPQKDNRPLALFRGEHVSVLPGRRTVAASSRIFMPVQNILGSAHTPSLCPLSQKTTLYT